MRHRPKPYNHPVRTAESVAVLDLLSGGRVDLGPGRSATRAELEGFDIDPAESRRMWQEAIGHVVGCWTNDEYEFSGKYWQMPRRRVQPKPLQQPHPPLWGATTSDEGHAQVGDLGLGLCSFAVGCSRRRSSARSTSIARPWSAAPSPIGAFVNNQAATFTMAICALRSPRGDGRGEGILREWYPKTGARQIATLTDWMAERNEGLGNGRLRGGDEEATTTKACSTCILTSNT